ncbi:MAG: hypothetical protein IPK79_01485 [Vampirovibrionales bacterium]|nr:hypothetical protein [Vampirovibrionales bacterium]
MGNQYAVGMPQMGIDPIMAQALGMQQAFAGDVRQFEDQFLRPMGLNGWQDLQNQSGRLPAATGDSYTPRGGQRSGSGGSNGSIIEPVVGLATFTGLKPAFAGAHDAWKVRSQGTQAAAIAWKQGAGNAYNSASNFYNRAGQYFHSAANQGMLEEAAAQRTLSASYAQKGETALANAAQSRAERMERVAAEHTTAGRGASRIPVESVATPTTGAPAPSVSTAAPATPTVSTTAPSAPSAASIQSAAQHEASSLIRTMKTEDLVKYLTPEQQNAYRQLGPDAQRAFLHMNRAELETAIKATQTAGKAAEGAATATKNLLQHLTPQELATYHARGSLGGPMYLNDLRPELEARFAAAQTTAATPAGGANASNVHASPPAGAAGKAAEAASESKGLWQRVQSKAGKAWNAIKAGGKVVARSLGKVPGGRIIGRALAVAATAVGAAAGSGVVVGVLGAIATGVGILMAGQLVWDLGKAIFGSDDKA